MSINRERGIALHFSASYCTTEMMALFPEAITQYVSTYSMNLFISIFFLSHPTFSHSTNLQKLFPWRQSFAFVFVCLSGKNQTR